MSASRSSARFRLHVGTGLWHTGSSSVSGANLHGQARNVPSTRGHPWTSCLTRSWRRLHHILHHTAKPSHSTERMKSPNTISQKRKRCLLNGCKRSFRACLILSTSLRWRPRLSVKAPFQRTAACFPGPLGPPRHPEPVKLVCARQAYAFVCVRGCCGGWFAAEVVSAQVGPAVTPRYLRVIDLGGLSPWRRRIALTP